VVIDGRKMDTIKCGSIRKIFLEPGYHKIHLEFEYRPYGTYSSQTIDFHLDQGENLEFKCGVNFHMMYLLYFSKKIIYLKKK
jgi:hypothetical protein